MTMFDKDGKRIVPKDQTKSVKKKDKKPKK